MLRRISGPKGYEIVEGWRKLHNAELRNLHSSPDKIRMNKSRRMRWAGHAAYMGLNDSAYKVLVVKLEGKRPLGRLNAGGRIILKWI
jgi:hypothetical protein